MTEKLNFRTILQSDIVKVGSMDRPMGFISWRLDSKNFRYILDLPITRVKLNGVDKLVSKTYCMYVTVDGEEGLKVLVPLGLLSNSRDIYAFKGDIIDADYFVGSSSDPVQIRLREPRLLGRSGYVICTIDYNLGC